MRRASRNMGDSELYPNAGIDYTRYGPGGPVVRLFPTKADRAAFSRTKERQQIDELIDSLPDPPVAPQRQEFSGKFNVRIPKSLHAALVSEAEKEGVSLNQLVLTKLALHLQER